MIGYLLYIFEPSSCTGYINPILDGGANLPADLYFLVFMGF